MSSCQEILPHDFYEYRYKGDRQLTETDGKGLPLSARIDEISLF
jgi:hypothetical protein